jgi:GNAT superfamily N-acetyltransferase
VRLAALRDAPYAFGATWENEKHRTEEEWRTSVVARTRFVAESDGQALGMASVGEAGVSRAASVTSFWVHPSVRGKGVADSLLLGVIDWAKQKGDDQLVLWVTEGNTRAEKLYERYGFRRTGASQRIRAGEERLEFEMSVRL